MYKLGKLPPKHNAKTLLMSDYLGAALPPPSSKRAWEYVIPANAWGDYGNNDIGDCTCAAKAHILMAVTANNHKPFVPPKDDVIQMYSAITGYNPVTGANDNGAAMTDVNEYLVKTGLSGHKALGWVKIDHTNRVHFEQCVELFGACDVGVKLPDSAIQQFDAGKPWDLVKKDNDIDGGHDIPYLGYGTQGETCVTWGKLQPTSLDWFAAYAEEGYGIIWEDWFDTTGVAPNHFDKDALWADLKALGV